MIVPFDELKRYRSKYSMVSGCFDPLHLGHIKYFEKAAQLGVPLLCNIAGDEYVRTKHRPVLSEDQRAEVLDSIRYITLTHISHRSTAEVLQELQPQFFIKGKDWEGKLPQDEVDVCNSLSIGILFLDTVIESSSRILKSLSVKNSLSHEAQQFENLVFSQEVIQPAHYSQEYFVNGWRENGNKYTLESRRQIEGRNPEFIREVFEPKRALDFGCGPGILIYLLDELNVYCDGIDFSPTSRKVAPPEVQERILLGSITEPIVPERSYDLVICREVLEHLTVLQIRQAVHQMCRASSKFIYLTTRFHPDPSDLLSITTDFPTDPTHITLLSKEFLRTLFVLEGFRSRHDLEAKMDWLKKGRVLVMERQV